MNVYVSPDDVQPDLSIDVSIRYRLVTERGEYLHQRKSGLTEDIWFAWIGTAEEAKDILHNKYMSSALTMEPVL